MVVAKSGTEKCLEDFVELSAEPRDCPESADMLKCANKISKSINKECCCKEFNTGERIKVASTGNQVLLDKKGEKIRMEINMKVLCIGENPVL